MARNLTLAIILGLAPLAPAGAVIALPVGPAPVAAPAPASVPVRAPKPPPPPSAPVAQGLQFGEFAAAGVGLLVLLLTFGTARMPPSVTA